MSHQLIYILQFICLYKNTKTRKITKSPRDISFTWAYMVITLINTDFKVKYKIIWHLSRIYLVWKIFLGSIKFLKWFLNLSRDPGICIDGWQATPPPLLFIPFHAEQKRLFCQISYNKYVILNLIRHILFWEAK